MTYYNEVDDIPHFSNYLKVNDFLTIMLYWVEQISELKLKNLPMLEECIIL